MELNQAINLIRNGVPRRLATWADIGAGTGLFTLALKQLLEPGSQVYAVDKSPHALYRSDALRQKDILIREGDFNRSLELPILDGILMANTLHYTPDPVTVLRNILQHLKKNGTFILVEYELENPVSTWIPYPITFRRFVEIAGECGLSIPTEMQRVPSRYGHQYIYSASAAKL